MPPSARICQFLSPGGGGAFLVLAGPAPPFLLADGLELALIDEVAEGSVAHPEQRGRLAQVAALSPGRTPGSGGQRLSRFADDSPRPVGKSGLGGEATERGRKRKSERAFALSPSEGKSLI